MIPVQPARRFAPPILLALLGPALALPQLPEPGGPFADAISAAQARVVKIYGGAIGREKGYASGLLVSGDGQIVTAAGVLLEGASLRATLPDGRVLPAQVIARDEARQLALLKVEAQDLPFFELGSSDVLEPGDWVIAAANPFKVADGPEPISVALGVFAGRAPLAARRRAQEFTFQGSVLLTDVIVATPGSAGGALVDWQGNLVGLIGKPVVSTRTNTVVNYALPVEELAAFLRNPQQSGADTASRDPALADRNRQMAVAAEVGLRLFDVGGRTRPAYVERVRPESPAARAGVRADDLLLSIGGQSLSTCDDYYAALVTLPAGQRVSLVVKRGERVLPLEIELAVPDVRGGH